MKDRKNKIKAKKKVKGLTERKISTMRLVVRRPLHPGFRFVLLVCLRRRGAGSGTAGPVVRITVN